MLQKTPEQRWHYSDAEWAEIDATVVAVRGTSLSVPEKTSLLEAAWTYRRDSAEPTGRVRERLNRNRLKPCAKVARLCDRLREALETVGGEGFLLPDDVGLALARKLFGEHADPPRPCVLSFGDMIGLLTPLGAAAAEIATHPSFRRPSALVSYTGRLDPQIIYFQGVLWLWTDFFGGELKFRRSAAGTPTGKLVRYFFAVTRPVMGRKTPSIASVPDIIKRQKAFSRWLGGYIALCRDLYPNLDPAGLSRASLTDAAFARLEEIARLADGGGEVSP
jgi:hypothetical protein